MSSENRVVVRFPESHSTALDKAVAEGHDSSLVGIFSSMALLNYNNIETTIRYVNSNLQDIYHLHINSKYHPEHHNIHDGFIFHYNQPITNEDKLKNIANMNKLRAHRKIKPHAKRSADKKGAGLDVQALFAYQCLYLFLHPLRGSIEYLYRHGKWASGIGDLNLEHDLLLDVYEAMETGMSEDESLRHVIETRSKKRGCRYAEQWSDKEIRKVYIKIKEEYMEFYRVWNPIFDNLDYYVDDGEEGHQPFFPGEEEGTEDEENTNSVARARNRVRNYLEEFKQRIKQKIQTRIPQNGKPTNT
jgi:hypothetical protein